MGDDAPAKFVAACIAAKVTHIIFVRHANAAPLRTGAAKRTDAPHDWKLDDQQRVLTPKGGVQCTDASSWFCALSLRALLTSPARRAAETAMRMSSKYETEESKEASLFLRMIESAHPAGMNETCEMLFETMGYGPLRKFFDAESGKEAFTNYGDRVCAELESSVSGPAFFEEAGGSGTCLALFGHAVFLNAIAFRVAEAAGASEKEQATLLDMDLGETQGILLDLKDGSVEQKTA